MTPGLSIGFFVHWLNFVAWAVDHPIWNPTLRKDLTKGAVLCPAVNRIGDEGSFVPQFPIGLPVKH
jgi:hypothetical protein